VPEGTRIELLYFDGCPSHTPAGEFLREALAEGGLEAEVELVAVNTDDEARRLRFPGSPTIRVDGACFPPSTLTSGRTGASAAACTPRRRAQGLSDCRHDRDGAAREAQSEESGGFLADIDPARTFPR